MIQHLLMRERDMELLESLLKHNKGKRYRRHKKDDDWVDSEEEKILKQEEEEEQEADMGSEPGALLLARRLEEGSAGPPTGVEMVELGLDVRVARDAGWGESQRDGLWGGGMSREEAPVGHLLDGRGSLGGGEGGWEGGMRGMEGGSGGDSGRGVERGQARRVGGRRGVGKAGGRGLSGDEAMFQGVCVQCVCIIAGLCACVCGGVLSELGGQGKRERASTHTHTHTHTHT